jgi:uncharacterized protein involved in exopolysaccharide biosynthesis/Mrp family chromosome partitioning ATPase
MTSANRTNTPNGANGHSPAAGMTQDDVYFTLFRHKWLILGFCCLGVVGALTVRVIRPPMYMSQFKLMIPFVVSRAVSEPGHEDQVRQTDTGAQSTLNMEVDILTSSDVAMRAAAAVGPEKILAMKGGGNDLQSAARFVGGGLTVDPPKTAVLTVTFRHPDKRVVQPVLAAVLTNYQQKHVEVYLGDRARENNLSQQMEEIRLKLAQTDEDLKAEKKRANVPFPTEAEASLQKEVAKATSDLFDARRELAERSAMAPEAARAQASGLKTNVLAQTPDADTFEEYGDTIASLQTSKKLKREAESKGYTENHPILGGVIERIQKLSARKLEMETKFPELALFGITAGRGATNGTDAVAAALEIKGLKAKVTALEEYLRSIETEASQVMAVQPMIARLTRVQAEQQKSYNFAERRLEAIRNARENADKAVSDMSLVDPPSPPKIDYKKFMKLIGIALGGSIGFGFALAFLIDLVLDRTIRRSTDVEKHLHLPVFLSIPDTAWTPKLAWPWQKRAGANANGNSHWANGEEDEEETALAPWKPGNDMQTHAEGLRERLLTYFEVNNLNLKKPKLVALTGCGSGSGVTTLASGLAAALSKTGDGNVLLVDMNSEHGIAHSFANGKPGCGLSDVLEPEGRGEAQVQDNLYLARIDDRGEGKAASLMPSRFNSLVPRLKASDYDYIIFDMPAVSPTSITPRMASHMDIVLLVLESEKTGQHRAAKASALMRESRANVAAVLNKCRQHVPAGLSQEL